MEHLQDRAAAVATLVRGHRSATVRACKYVREHFERAFQVVDSGLSEDAIGPQAILFGRTCLLDDAFWEMRLRVLLDVFFLALRAPPSAVVSERVLSPCLAVLRRLCAPAAAPAFTVGSSGPAPLADGSALAVWLKAAGDGASVADAVLPAAAAAVAAATDDAPRSDAPDGTQPADLDAPVVVFAGGLDWLPQILMSTSSRVVRQDLISIIKYVHRLFLVLSPAYSPHPNPTR